MKKKEMDRENGGGRGSDRKHRGGDMGGHGGHRGNNFMNQQQQMYYGGQFN
jgi:hypothetical protein